jgi:hypothetical protein
MDTWRNSAGNNNSLVETNVAKDLSDGSSSPQADLKAAATLNLITVGAPLTDSDPMLGRTI